VPSLARGESPMRKYWWRFKVVRRELEAKRAAGTLLGIWLGLPERAILAAGKVVWLDPQLTVDGRLRHGIQFIRFGSDASLVGYRGYLTQIAPSQEA